MKSYVIDELEAPAIDMVIVDFLDCPGVIIEIAPFLTGLIGGATRAILASLDTAEALPMWNYNGGYREIFTPSRDPRALMHALRSNFTNYQLEHFCGCNQSTIGIGEGGSFERRVTEKGGSLELAGCRAALRAWQKVHGPKHRFAALELI